MNQNHMAIRTGAWGMLMQLVASRELYFKFASTGDAGHDILVHAVALSDGR
jgi:hypothetical protein